MSKNIEDALKVLGTIEECVLSGLVKSMSITLVDPSDELVVYIWKAASREAGDEDAVQEQT
jgi:hypothetical protein